LSLLQHLITALFQLSLAHYRGAHISDEAKHFYLLGCFASFSFRILHQTKKLGLLMKPLASIQVKIPFSVSSLLSLPQTPPLFLPKTVLFTFCFLRCPTSPPLSFIPLAVGLLKSS